MAVFLWPVVTSDLGQVISRPGASVSFILHHMGLLRTECNDMYECLYDSWGEVLNFSYKLPTKMGST